MKNKLKIIAEKIKKSNFYKLLRFRSEINDLKGEISLLRDEKQKLNDLCLKQKNELKNRKNNDIAIMTYETLIEKNKEELEKTKESNKKLIQKNKKLNKENQELQNQSFENDMEMKRLSIQVEEYEAQIKDLKSDRYLVRKVKPGRTPNTNKTKISMPMSGNVIRYMRGEHE